MATAYLSVCTTNLQIPTVICYIHLLILPTSKTPSCSLNVLDFYVFVVITPIFPTEDMCQFFKKRGYPDSVVNVTEQLAQQTDRQQALQTGHEGKDRENSIYAHLKIPITSKQKTSF